jgi:hypothetical protein
MTTVYSESVRSICAKISCWDNKELLEVKEYIEKILEDNNNETDDDNIDNLAYSSMYKQ